MVPLMEGVKPDILGAGRQEESPPRRQSEMASPSISLLLVARKPNVNRA